MSGPQSAPHLDLDRLADLLAGEGSDADVAHVGACAGCAGRLDELSVAEVEVAAALAALPAPELPPDLAERLTAALAAEPALAPTTPGWAAAPTADPAPSEGSRTVTPFPTAGARRERRWLAPLGAAAALVLVVGGLGGAIVAGGGGGGDDSADTAASGGGSAAEESAPLDVPTSSTGQDYAAAGSLAAALPGVLAGQALGRASAGEAAPAPSSGDTSEGTLDSGDALTAGDPLARLRDPAALAACLNELLPADDTTVLALDYAAYAGEPALAVVLPATGAPDKVDVFVVGAGCSAGNDQTRFFTRLDRP